MYMQSLAAASPIESFHGSPGPSHHVASSLLPGSNRRRDGVAVTVTEMTPAGVVMYAVTEIGFHITRGTQNHVPTFTTSRSRAGAVRNTRAFNLSDAVAVTKGWLAKGFTGLRIFTGGSTKEVDASSLHDPRAYPVWELMSERGLSMCIQTDAVHSLGRLFLRVVEVLDADLLVVQM